MPSMDMSLCGLVVQSTNGAWDKVLESGIQPDHLFDDGRRIFEHIRNHFAQYGKVPDVATVLRDTNLTVPALADIPEPVEYYIARVRERATDNLAKEKVKAALQAMDRGDTKGAIQSAADLLTEIQRQNLAGELVGDWTQQTQKRWDKYQEAKLSPGGLTGLPTPWDLLNEQTQGIQPGDMWILVARPSCGKTWIEVVWAMHLWKMGHKVLFISLEMQKDKIERRMDANYAKLDYRNLRKGQLGMIAEPVYQSALAGLAGKPPLHIVTRKSVKSISDVAVLVERLKPDITIIDGMYKLKTPGMQKASKWEQITEIMDRLHEMIQDKNHRVLASTQLSRQAGKSKTSADLEDIAFADAIGMNADVIVGLRPTKEMREKNETLIRMLKNREDSLIDFRAKFNDALQEFDQIGVWHDPKGGGEGGFDEAESGGGTEVTY